MSTNENQKISRRQFILSVLSGMAAVTLNGCGTVERPIARQLSKTIGDPVATRSLGRIYLDANPGEADLDRLVEKIDQGLIAAQSKGMSLDDPQLLAEVLDKQVRDDYRKGEVVRVDDWLLSRTEARIYACFTLS